MPTDRIDANGLALMNIFPQPNRVDLEATGHNYLRQETANHPRLNNVLRTDWKQSANTTFFSTLRTFSSKQTGSEITAGPPDWGFYDGTYEFSDSSISGGWNRIIGERIVNDLSGGIGRRTEGFGVGAEGTGRASASRTSATPWGSSIRSSIRWG